MTDTPTETPAADDRPYSPGLEGVIGAETALGYVDGAAGRLLYRGFRIGDLVERGSYAAVANLLWTGDWVPDARMATASVPPAVLNALRDLPRTAKPMDALRTAVSVWGAMQNLVFPPTAEQARALTAFSPSALAAFARIRQGLEPIEPDPALDLVEGFLYQLKGERAHPGDRPRARRVLRRRRRARPQRVDVHRPGHRLDTLRHRVGGHGRHRGHEGPAPRRGSVRGRRADPPGRLARAGRGVDPRRHRPQGAADGLRPSRLPRLRPAGERRSARSSRRWTTSRTGSSSRSPSRTRRCASSPRSTRTGPLKTNVEYYAAAVLQGVGLAPDLFPATFALARHAGWTAHAIEQAADNRLIRPDARYTGPAERDLPGLNRRRCPASTPDAGRGSHGGTGRRLRPGTAAAARRPSFARAAGHRAGRPVIGRAVRRRDPCTGQTGRSAPARVRQHCDTPCDRLTASEGTPGGADAGTLATAEGDTWKFAWG